MLFTISSILTYLNNELCYTTIGNQQRANPNGNNNNSQKAVNSGYAAPVSTYQNSSSSDYMNLMMTIMTLESVIAMDAGC